MKIIDDNLLDKVCEQAKQNPRRRQNYNFHPTDETTINRLLNAMELDTYIMPHRHPEKEEICLLLKGRVAIFLFDENGTILERKVFDPKKGKYGFEIEPHVWHTCVPLESGTVVYEIKQGPYRPLKAEDKAPWAPIDPEQAKGYIKKLREYQPSKK